MDFGRALEQVRTGGKGMRLPQWGKDVVVRCYNPIQDLDEIAKAVHNAWWEEKKKQDVTNHPDMIPYEELAENVNEYDRVTARTVISALKPPMTACYLYVESRFGRVPWKETFIELFDTSWEIVD